MMWLGIRTGTVSFFFCDGVILVVGFGLEGKGSKVVGVTWLIEWVVKAHQV